MRRALEQLAAFGESACAIIANEHAPKRRDSLLAFLQLKMGRIPSSAPGAIPRVKLFGCPMEYLDREGLFHLFEEIFCHQDYYFASDSANPLIVDCGANIGLTVLYFKRLHPKCRIVAFEPDARTFGVLKGNIERNGWKDVTMHNAAVAAERKRIPFYFDPQRPGSPMMSTQRERMSAACVTVDGVPLSEFLENEVDFLKMDIEGAEAEVLPELARAGKLRNIRQMVVEYHHHLLPRADQFSQILNLLEQNGFGYQIASPLRRPFARERFQDVLIFAYRK